VRLGGHILKARGHTKCICGNGNAFFVNRGGRAAKKMKMVG